MKISPADQAFSKCVRERANWTCERCGSVHEKGSMGLHCSHNFSRRHRTIRWEPLNALALCFTCHQWFGGSPYESGPWLGEFLGDGAMEILIEKKSAKFKIPKSEEKAIGKHYREQLKDMEKKRNDGETGRIEFIGYF